jgi:hypothetical protein
MSDSHYERLDDGTLRLHTSPVHGLSAFDQYALAAHALRDVLSMVNGHMPGLLWATGLKGATDALEGLRRSDPHKSQDPLAVLIESLKPEE